jgi:hypothetical protein
VSLLLTTHAHTFPPPTRPLPAWLLPPLHPTLRTSDVARDDSEHCHSHKSKDDLLRHPGDVLIRGFVL